MNPKRKTRKDRAVALAVRLEHFCRKAESYAAERSGCMLQQMIEAADDYLSEVERLNKAGSEGRQ